MSKILIIDTCEDCYNLYDEYFKCSGLHADINNCGNRIIPTDCPLQDAYQEQEQEYMDRVK